MGAVWMCARAQLRARRGAVVVLGLMLGLMSGAATAAAVGARRTESAYPRFAERYHPYDVSLSTGSRPDTDQIFEKISTLPLVRSTSRGSLYFGAVRTDAGKQLAFPDVFLISEPDRKAGSSPAYKIVAGRNGNPAAPDEAVANYAMAERLDLRPGDRITITLMSQSEEQPLPPSAPIRVRVVGVMAYLGGFESATGFGFPSVFWMSPAFGKRWIPYRSGIDDNLSVLLRHGEADADAFERQLKENNIPTDGPPQRASSFTKGVQDLNRVPAVALWLLCGFLALTTLAVFSQLIAREAQLTGRDDPVLRGLGFSQRHLFVLGMIRASTIALVGATAGIGVAILLSPLTPVGLARIAEPDPGFMFAPGTLAVGAVATAGLVLLISLGPAWIAARRASGHAGSTSEPRSSITAALTRIGAPPSMRSGVALATQPGRGERAVPVRTAALGLTMAIAALAGALGFAISLQKLIVSPRLAGYPWDAGAIGNASDEKEMTATLPRLEASIHRAMPGATMWRGTVFLVAAVEGLEIGAYVSDGPGPSVIQGRAPRRIDEIALDPRTLRGLAERIGGTVNVANVAGRGERDASRRMTIVGTFAVPRVAFQSQLPGQGVAFTPATAIALNPDAPPADTVFVRFATERNFDRDLAVLRAATREDAFTIVNRTQSATVGNVERMSELPLVLAGIVGVLGAATLAHALTTTVRRRRRDLAILKTLGFMRRQVRATVAWQCTTLAVLALAVGVPLGIAGGRWGWRLFAQQLQVVPLPAGALAAAIGIPLGTLVLGNLIAAAPARAAARTPAAVVLRTE